MRLCAMAKPKCRTEGCLWLSPCRKGFLLAGEFKMCSKGLHTNVEDATSFVRLALCSAQTFVMRGEGTLFHGNNLLQTAYCGELVSAG